MTDFGLLRGLARLRDCRTGRLSSWDRTGGNRDYVVVEPGETTTIVDLDGPGCLTHLWLTVACDDPLWSRKLVFVAWWDDEPQPSIRCPFGDFFGLGHGMVRPYAALPMSVVTAPDGHGGRAGFNCYLPMPFDRRARLAVANEGRELVRQLFYNVDFERYAALDADLGRFHASWRSEQPARGYTIGNHDEHVATPNLTGQHNYVVVEARGRGHYVGTVLSVDNVDVVPGMTWWGEGDEMVFVDDDVWPPRLHGTGTEDYFNAAWNFPSGAYSAPYHGLTIAGSLEDWSGRWTAYRFHVEDPIVFDRSLRFTIEHGHANWQSNHYSSVAYWYQTEPHLPLPDLPPAGQRLPLDPAESRRRFHRAAG